VKSWLKVSSEYGKTPGAGSSKQRESVELRESIDSALTAHSTAADLQKKPGTVACCTKSTRTILLQEHQKPAQSETARTPALFASFRTISTCPRSWSETKSCNLTDENECVDFLPHISIVLARFTKS